MTSSPSRLRVGAALFAAILAVGLTLPPSVSAKGGHGGNGDTQGRSQSNPDGGGVDKPYPADGQAARSQGDSDWDGNNGCGNDDDREDDNNGWCGRKPDHEHAKDDSAVRSASLAKHDDHAVKAAASDVGMVQAASAGAGAAPAMRASEASAAPAQVLGVSIERGAAATAPAAGATVLGTSESRGTVGALALTGFEMATLALAAMVLIAVGLVTRRYGMARPQR